MNELDDYTEVTTVDENGNTLLITHGDVKSPADYSFASVKHFIHCESPQYEELQSLCLGMASEIESLKQIQTKKRIKDPDLEKALQNARENNLSVITYNSENIFISRGENENTSENLACPSCGGSGHANDAKIHEDEISKKLDIVFSTNYICTFQSAAAYVASAKKLLKGE